MALYKTDPDIAAAVEAEGRRQELHLELIASENVVSEAVLEAMGLSGNITEYLANSSPFRSWEPALLERYVAMFEDVKLGV